VVSLGMIDVLLEDLAKRAGGGFVLLAGEVL
jgi:hypothetical protein